MSHDAARTPRHEPLPPWLAAVADAGADDRPVPALGLGDPEVAEALVQAVRLLLAASTPDAAVVAVATFAVQLGGRLVPAARASASAMPLDIALGTTAPVLVDAPVLSVERMRLEQHLPGLLEDARLVTARLRHVRELEAAAGRRAAPEAWTGGSA